MKKVYICLCVMAFSAALLCGCTNKEPEPLPSIVPEVTETPMVSIKPTETNMPDNNATETDGNEMETTED